MRYLGGAVHEVGVAMRNLSGRGHEMPKWEGP